MTTCPVCHAQLTGAAGHVCFRRVKLPPAPFTVDAYNSANLHRVNPTDMEARLAASRQMQPGAAALTHGYRASCPTCADVMARFELLLAAIKAHHSQRADDRCWLDDEKLYEAAGLGPVDRRVGDRAAMLANCERFLNRRCAGGHWPSYVDLEARIEMLKAVLTQIRDETRLTHAEVVELARQALAT